MGAQDFELQEMNAKMPNTEEMNPSNVPQTRGSFVTTVFVAWLTTAAGGGFSKTVPYTTSNI